MQRPIHESFGSVDVLPVMFGEGQHITVVIDDGKLGSIVERTLQSFDDRAGGLHLPEKAFYIVYADIKKHGGADRTADLRQLLAQAFEYLEHEGNVSRHHHGPYGTAFFGHAGHKLKTELFIKGERLVHIADKKIRSDAIHGVGLYVSLPGGVPV